MEIKINRKNNQTIESSYRRGIGAVIFNKDKNVLLCQRISRKTVGATEDMNHIGIPTTLQFPQGGINDNEEIHQALYREIYEEVGLCDNLMMISESLEWHSYKFPIHAKQKLYNGKYIGQKQKWFLLYFYGDESEIDICRHHEPEFSSFYWLDICQATRYALDFKKRLYAEITAEFFPILRDYAIPDFSKSNPHK